GRRFRQTVRESEVDGDGAQRTLAGGTPEGEDLLSVGGDTERRDSGRAGDAIAQPLGTARREAMRGIDPDDVDHASPPVKELATVGAPARLGPLRGRDLPAGVAAGVRPNEDRRQAALGRRVDEKAPVGRELTVRLQPRAPDHQTGLLLTAEREEEDV